MARTTRGRKYRRNLIIGLGPFARVLVLVRINVLNVCVFVGYSNHGGRGP